MNIWKKIKNRDFKHKNIILASLILTMVCILAVVGTFLIKAYNATLEISFFNYDMIFEDVYDEMSESTFTNFEDIYNYIIAQKSISSLTYQNSISNDAPAYGEIIHLAEKIEEMNMYNYNIYLYYENEAMFISLKDVMSKHDSMPIQTHGLSDLRITDETFNRIRTGGTDCPSFSIVNGNDSDRAKLILSQPFADKSYLVIEYTYSDLLETLPGDFLLCGIDVIVSDYTNHKKDGYPDLQFSLDNDWQIRLSNYTGATEYPLEKYDWLVRSLDPTDQVSDLVVMGYLNLEYMYDMSRALGIRMIIFMSTLTAASAALVFLLYKLLYSPVKRIVKDLPEEQSETNEYAVISRYIDDVEDENRNLKYRLEGAESQASKESFVNKLIENIHAPDDVAAHFNVVFEHPKFVTAVLCGGSQTILEKLLESFRQKLNEHQIVVYSGWHDSEYVLLINFDGDSIETIKSIAADVLGTHSIVNDATSNILIGEIFDSLAGFYKAYLKIGEEKLYLDITGRASTVMTYDDLRAERKHENLENRILEKIQRLIGYISVGDFNQAKGITDTVFEDLVNQDNESLENINKQIASTTAIIAMAVNNKKSLPDDLIRDLNCTDRLCKTTNIRLLKKECDYIFDTLIEHNRLESMKSAKLKNIDIILDYINKNYCDSSLSINAVADYANVSVATVSRLVKEHCGATYTDYVAELRVNKIKEMLANTDMSLENIAVACGYNSVPVMRSAFLKITGISPGQYRKSLK